MKTALSKWLRLAALVLTGFALEQSPAATNLTVQNPGFDTATGDLADAWNSNGGSVRGGTEGGYGWDTSYFGGAFPTNSTFATTLEGPVRQDLAGPGSTFVAGATYQLKVDLFGSSSYKHTDSRMWTLALTADGAEVAKDQWFSDEFAAQSISNGGAIPDNHIIAVNATSTGLTTATLTFTVPSFYAGQVIGIKLGGDASSVYTLAPGSPATNDYYGMMDNVSLTVSEELIPGVDVFFADASSIGDPITLYWTIVNPSALSSLTLHDGNLPISVLSNTDATTGEGSIIVDPTRATNYTLTANGASSKQVTITGAVIQSFVSSSGLATLAANHQVTLDWQVYPPGFAVSISDGTTTYDVSGETDELSGFGSRSFTVPDTLTTFTFNLNNGEDTATVQVVREAGNTPALSLNKLEYSSGELTTVTWAGATGNEDSWIGIYKAANIPDEDLSDQWNYLSGNKDPVGSHPAGSMNFTLPPGNYYAVLFIDEGYTIEHGPVAFTVVEPEAPLGVVSISRTGNSVTLEWKSEANLEYDIYASETLEGSPQTAWNRIRAALPSNGDGTTTFTEELPDPAPPRRFYRIYEVEPGP